MSKKNNILLIGSSGYIGSSILNLAHDDKIKVIATYNQNSDFLKDYNSSQIEFHQLDLTNDHSIILFLEKIKSEMINTIIFSSAALEKEVLSSSTRGNYLDDFQSEISKQYIEVNSSTTLRIISSLKNNLIESGNGNIIFLGSLVGKKALKAPPAFSLGKSCINGLVESLSKELGPYNIKVNSVDPGILESGVAKYICDQDKKDYLEHCALKRFGTAKEVANLCYYLATKNTFLTGRSILLDGAL